MAHSQAGRVVDSFCHCTLIVVAELKYKIAKFLLVYKYRLETNNAMPQQAPTNFSPRIT